MSTRPITPDNARAFLARPWAELEDLKRERWSRALRRDPTIAARASEELADFLRGVSDALQAEARRADFERRATLDLGRVRELLSTLEQALGQSDLIPLFDRLSAFAPENRIVGEACGTRHARIGWLGFERSPHKNGSRRLCGGKRHGGASRNSLGSRRFFRDNHEIVGDVGAVEMNERTSPRHTLRGQREHV